MGKKIQDANCDIVEDLREADKFIILQNDVLNSLNNGVLGYTMPERKIVLFNYEAKRIFGDAVADNINLDEVITKEIRDLNKEQFSECSSQLKNPGDSVFYRLRIPKNDSELIIDVNTKFLQIYGGQKIILSTMQDVTEKDRLSKMLQEERSRYRDALIKNSEYFYSFDVTEGYLLDDIILPDGTGLVSSLGMKLPVKYDDYCQKAISENRLKILTPGVENFLTCEGIINSYNSGITSATLEHYQEDRDEYRRIVMLFSMSPETNHIQAFTVATNITKERKKGDMAKQALIEAYNSATRANKAKTDFLSRMSHDIRTPINAIVGMTAIASMNLEDREKVQDCLSKITVASNHLLGLINDVLDMSKIESGRIDLQVEDFNITDLVDTLVTIAKPQLEDKKHIFNLKTKDLKHKNVVGDSQRLQQVFMNLISNAIKYTPDGGKINFTVTEKSTHKKNVGSYEFIIEDNGIGISDEYMKKIFDPFSRADDERISKIQGTGLGMPIAKNIIQMMGGDIKIESHLNKGTKVTVTIYLELQDEKNCGDKKESSQKNINDNGDKSLSALKDFENVDYSKNRILLVEDNEINLEIAVEILNITKVKIETARNGKEALEKVIKAPDNYYDVILMDVQMPIMTGYEATKEIRSLGREYTSKVPIVAMTANAFSDDIIASKNAGMNEHIAKPLKFDVLLKTLKKWI